ncbi:cytochrome P450 [Streptomyces sp. CA-111067]|uniref:cytochrome P450 n=1 Tax=Streptomyces sp. CA-111067 TaxID=3240046 RepID=UPI003D951359
MAPTTPPQAPAALPVLGHAPAFVRDPLAVVSAGRQAHGPVFTLRLGPKRAAVVVGVDESRAAINEPETTLAVAPVYQWLRPMFGAVMQAADHADYLVQRAALLPVFRGRQVADHTAAVTEDVSGWIDGLGPSGTFDAGRDLERLTLDIATRLVLGKDFRERHGDTFRPLFRDVAAGMEFVLPSWTPTPRLLRRNRARKRLFALLAPQVRRARTDPDPAGQGFLAHLAASTAADGAPFDDDTVTGLALVLVYAAYETTAAQLAWSVLLLLQHQGELAATAKEIHTELADADPTPGTLHRLTRLGWCLQEAQRLRPVTTMLTRQVAAPFEVAGFTVPKGWTTLFCPPVTHRDPDRYPDPERFDPERFSTARDPDGRAAAGLLNMGGGGHACLGGRVADIEMKLIIALLLRRYELTLSGPAPEPTRKPGISRPAGPCPVAYRQLPQ